MKKRIISIFLIVSIVVSIVAISAINTSAYGYTEMDAPSSVSFENRDGALRISWTPVYGAYYYRIIYRYRLYGTRYFTPNFVYPYSYTYDVKSFYPYSTNGTISHYISNPKPGTEFEISIASIDKNGREGNATGNYYTTYLSKPKISVLSTNVRNRVELRFLPAHGSKYEVVRWVNGKQAGRSIVNSNVCYAGGIVWGKTYFQVRAIRGRCSSVWSAAFRGWA